MKIDKDALEIIGNYNSDPSNQQAVSRLGSVYWNIILSRVKSIINEKGDLLDFINSEESFIDSGNLKEVSGEQYEEKQKALENNTFSCPHIKIQRVSEWLKEIYKNIFELKKQDIIRKDIDNQHSRIKNNKQEIEELQELRRETMLNELSEKYSSDSKQLLKIVNQMADCDELLFENLKSKAVIKKGGFLPADQRRKYVEQENKIQSENQKIESVVSSINNVKTRKNIHQLNKKISFLMSDVVDAEDCILKLEREIKDLEEKEKNISDIEIQNCLCGEIEYLRDLLRLSAKRIRMQSCSILRPVDKFVTSENVGRCFSRILEFDPGVFNNGRAKYLGKPFVLFVPGNGNALYDWKNNRFIVPMVPPDDDIVKSVASAIVEYRLDVDEDKEIINSYWKLTDNKGFRSTFQLKGKFIKEYIIWIKSEYKGFRVLSKDSRKWFEREIAPDRNEIYCPPHYQKFNMTTSEFRAELDELESKIGGDNKDFSSDDLWAASILNYQQGEFQRSYDFLVLLIRKKYENDFIYYNLGQVGMKSAHKKEAAAAFGEFIKRRPQSWWASVARQHLRRLQA